MNSRFLAGRTAAPITLALALAVGVGLGWQMRGDSASADEGAAAIARVEADRFYSALAGDGVLDEILGDAFQLMRNDGSRYDRDAYLANPASVAKYTLSDFQAVEADGVLTATFLASAIGRVEDVERDTHGLPRMAVFNKVDGAWKLQAFANLGVGLASGIEIEAKEAVARWTASVASGDIEAVGDILAPEFQLVRADGSAYTAAEYLAGGLPKIDAIFEIENIVVTGFGDYIVVRYELDLDETVAGGRIQGNAPRLTVFRRKGDAWLVVAHSNFGRLEK